MAGLKFLGSSLTYLLLFLLLISRVLNAVACGEEAKDYYIVYLGDSPFNRSSAVQKHLHLLSSARPRKDDVKESMVYSYTKSFNAFAAKQSKDEAEMLPRI